LRQRIEDIEARQKYFVDTIEQFRLKIFERDVEVFELDVSLMYFCLGTQLIPNRDGNPTPLYL
jgi:hypothetical protein